MSTKAIQYSRLDRWAKRPAVADNVWTHFEPLATESRLDRWRARYLIEKRRSDKKKEKWAAWRSKYGRKSKEEDRTKAKSL